MGEAFLDLICNRIQRLQSPFGLCNHNSLAPLVKSIKSTHTIWQKSPFTKRTITGIKWLTCLNLMYIDNLLNENNYQAESHWALLKREVTIIFFFKIITRHKVKKMLISWQMETKSHQHKKGFRRRFKNTWTIITVWQLLLWHTCI